MKIVEQRDYYEKANLSFISMSINYFHIFYFLKNDKLLFLIFNKTLFVLRKILNTKL